MVSLFVKADLKVLQIWNFLNESFVIITETKEAAIISLCFWSREFADHISFVCIYLNTIFCDHMP